MNETKGTIYVYEIGRGEVFAFEAILVFPDVGVGGFEFPPRVISRTEMTREIRERGAHMAHMAEIMPQSVIETVFPRAWDREEVLISFNEACAMMQQMIEDGYDGH